MMIFSIRCTKYYVGMLRVRKGCVDEQEEVLRSCTAEEVTQGCLNCLGRPSIVNINSHAALHQQENPKQSEGS